MSHHADKSPPYAKLEIKASWEKLTTKQKYYAHHLAKAANAGLKISMAQTSHESPKIADFLTLCFKDRNSRGKCSEDEWNAIREYASQFFANCGNYKSFGDAKFIPRVEIDVFEKMEIPEAVRKMLLDLKQDIWSIDMPLIGFPSENGMSGFYPGDSPPTKEEIERVSSMLETKGLSPLNTRLPSSKRCLVASAKAKTDKIEDVEIQYGDFSAEMSSSAKHIRCAIPFVENDTQKAMLECYASSFETGSMDDHRESQKHWVKDVGPIVESNIGFVETYRDPAGIRAEWEGFVAIVNLERSKIFASLVNKAPRYIERLPWPSAFEKPEFNKPDFTALEVLTFAGGGIPAGINIPNYDDIRETVGFKNVSLSNVLNAKAPSEKLTFIEASVVELFEKHRGHSFEIQVGIHELLGHGTGLLLAETKAGEYNFDIKNMPMSPITQKPVSTYYRLGQNWSNVFGGIASTYEECRAESVAMYLSCEDELLELFGTADKDKEDVLYIAWLSMARAGLTALEFWDPATSKWGQAHMQARFAILQVFLRAGNDFVKLEQTEDNLTIHMDRTQIRTTGRKAIGDFLQKLHVYKCTADFPAGSALYSDYTTVQGSFLEMRRIVVARKLPRKQLVQANTFEVGGEIVLKEYATDKDGMIASYIDRLL